MKEFLFHGRFIFDGSAFVEAADEDEARQKFNAGDFEFDHNAASLADWEARKVEECK